MDDSAATRALREDTEEMRNIVETLLNAERLGSAHTVLDRADVLLPELADSLRERFFAPRLRVKNYDELNTWLMDQVLSYAKAHRHP